VTSANNAEPLNAIRASRSRRPPRTLVVAALLIGALFAAPFAYVVIQNIRLGADFGDILTDGETWATLRRSLSLAIAVSVTSAAVGTGLAWMVVRTDVPFRKALAIVAPLPLVFPSFVGATALISGFATGGLLHQVVDPIGISLPELRGFRAAWLVLTLFTYPYVYLPVAARLKRLPTSLEESGRILGRSPQGVFATIVWPQIRTAVSAGSLLVFLYTISDFGAVELLRYDTFTRKIYANQLADRGTAMAFSLLLGLVALAVVAAERSLVRRDPPTATNSRGRGMVVPLGRLRWPAFGAIAVFYSIAIAGPVASLAHWTIRGARASRTSGSLAVSSDGLASAVANTVLISVVAAVVTVAVVMPVAYLSMRHRSRLGNATHGLVVAGFALPGLVTALAIVFWVLNTSALVRFYQTLPLLVLAYVIHFGAQASGAARVAVSTIPRPLEDAARMLGAARFRRFSTIELPLMVPGLVAAAGLVLLSTMKELPATLLLSPIGFDTLATEIWASMDNVAYAQAGLESMVLLAVSAVLTWTLVIRVADRFD
jgi:iron(III) transport system permease protein